MLEALPQCTMKAAAGRHIDDCIFNNARIEQDVAGES